MKSAPWYFVTGEYPPTVGGVSDYTENVARGLAQEGESVTVLAPARGRNAGEENREGVRIIWLPGNFDGSGRRALWDFLDKEAPGGRVLLQYVPHAFGWKGMNIPLIVQLTRQRRHALWVMFHEVSYPLEAGQLWRHRLLARVTRWMAARLVEAAERVLVSTAAWTPLLESICGREVLAEWAPIPSNFEGSIEPSPKNVRALSHGDGRRSFLLGHFGTYGKLITDPLAEILPAILERCPEADLVLMGRGSVEFCAKLEKAGVIERGRVHGTGELEPLAVAERILSCDLLIQPYPDGVSTRRTSAMCGLALGRPMVTRAGALTEPIWRDSGAVRLVDSGEPAVWASAVRELLDVPQQRERLGEAARILYRQEFSLAKTVELLRHRELEQGTAPPTTPINSACVKLP